MGEWDTDTPQFRDAVTAFAQKEVAPRAAEIDRTNTFPVVGASNRRSRRDIHNMCRHLSGSLGEAGVHGTSWRNGIARVRWSFLRLFPPYARDGRVVASVRLRGTLIWRSFQLMCQPSKSRLQNETNNCSPLSSLLTYRFAWMNLRPTRFIGGGPMRRKPSTCQTLLRGRRLEVSP